MAQSFSEGLCENHQNNCTQYKTTKTTFTKKSKAVLISIQFRKASQTQDVKSQITERSVRKISQPKRDAAFEQKTRIVSCREISAKSQNSFFYLQPKNQAEQSWAELKKTFLERTQRRFGKFVLLKKQKLFFYKLSITQDNSNEDVKSESTKRSLQKLAQPKRDSPFEQKTRIVPRI